MSSRVGAAAPYQIDSLTGDGLNCIPYDALDADVILLDLPAVVAGPVKGKRQTNVPGGSCHTTVPYFIDCRA
jgi:hypothetical protein